MKYNPYKPGHTIHPGMFCGREAEIETIERSLFQTKNENPKNFLITGERGIGKTSLLSYASHLAKGSIKKEYNFLVISFELEAQFQFSQVIDKFIAETKAQLYEEDKLKSLMKTILNILEQIESEVIKFKKKETEIYSAIADLAKLLKKIVSSNKVDGVLILIDEADRPSEKARLGAFLKILTERLTKIDCNKVCIGLSGLPEVMDKLKKSHESSVRLFHVLNLEVLKAKERLEIISNGLKEANEKNEVKTEITEGASRMISELSQGYPYFLQQFSYCCFEFDEDNKIDENDVDKGLYDKKVGALKQLGENLFDDIYFKEVESTDYRKVLKYMSSFSDEWVSRKTIIKNCGITDYTVDNALSSLKKKNIILSNKQRKGEYRLPSKSFATWINIFTDHQEKNGI